MAAPAGAGLCKGCGNRRGTDHCVFPSKQGPRLNDPNHPQNNGVWEAYWLDAMKAKKLDTKTRMTDAQLAAVVLYPNKGK